MTLVRLVSRIALLLLAAAALAGLTAWFGASVRPSLPNAGWQSERRHRAAGPDVGKVSEFVGALGLVALFAVAGRLIFRLRLNPAPRGEGEAILLGLERGRNPAGAKVH